MVKGFCTALCFLIFLGSNAQTINSDSIVPHAISYAKNIYNSERGNDLAIYNGTLHYPYLYTIDGIAYFPPGEWQSGTVVYDNIFYEDIPMKYDLVTDQLIITSLERSVPLALFSPRVKEFSFSGFKFIRIEQSDSLSLLTGFYQVLAEGKITALARTTKTISEIISGTTLYRKFEQKVKFYILKNGQYMPVSNKNSLLSVLKEKRGAVQNFISEQGLKFRKNPEQTIVAAVKFYNQ